MNEGIIKSFFNNDYYKFGRFENGNIHLVNFGNYAKLLSKHDFEKVLEEVLLLLHSDDASDFIFGVDLVNILKIAKYKNELIDVRKKIEKNKKESIPKYYIEFIDAALVELDK